jgi:RNA polymerase sigma factor (sigma-70 family)
MAATETSARANEVLDELYRQHVGDVYRYTYAVLGNHADAEDVTQTTFVNALRALERGEIPEEPSHWLTVIAHNLVRQRWRQAAARPTLVELEADVADAPEDDEAFELEELVRALQRIPETQREAIVMRELEGRSYAEIATVMGLSTSALETLLFRARRSLAEELENVVTCQNAELALSKQLDGRLSRKDRRRLDEHLADCPDCARLAATQQRQRRAFKGLALLPLPIGLALFKGAPSAAAATSLPTIGLASTGAGTSATGTGTAGAGATAASGSGAAAAGGSLAGGLALKIAAVVATAVVATGVGYKGVQAMRDTPAAPPPADAKPKVQTQPKKNLAGAAVAHATPAPKPKAPTRAKHQTGAGAKPEQTTHSVAPPAGGTAVQTSAGTGGTADVKTPVAAQETPTHVAPAKPKAAQPASGAKDVKQPKAPVGNPNAGVKQTPPAPPADTPVQTPPVGGQTAPVAPQVDSPALTGAPGSGGAAGTPQTPPTGTTEPPVTPPVTTPPPTETPPGSTETPPPTTPPSDTGDDPSGNGGGNNGNPNGNNGVDGSEQGRKLGHLKGNHDGRHPEDS